MLCRDADACYWIGRYTERAEAAARMIDVHYHTALESGSEQSDETARCWKPLLAISDGTETYKARYGTLNDRDAIQFFAFDLQNPDSILSCWRAARENSRSIREQLASEMWESVNISFLAFREWNVDRVLAEGPHSFLHQVKDASHLFQGILNRTMMMGETRDWLDTGRFLERGEQTARLLDVKYHDLLPAYREAPSLLREQEAWGVGGLLDMHSWIAVLKSVSAFEMYRKTYRTGIAPALIADFLVLHPQFPASLRHCIGRVQSCIKRISGTDSNSIPNLPERYIGRLYAELEYARPDEIIASGLHEFLTRSLEQCDAIGAAITEAYLSY